MQDFVLTTYAACVVTIRVLATRKIIPNADAQDFEYFFFGQTESHNNVALPQSVPVGFADAQTIHAADADASDVHDVPQLNQLDLMQVNSNVDRTEESVTMNGNNLEASVQDHHQILQEHVDQSDPEHPQEPVVQDRIEQHP